MTNIDTKVRDLKNNLLFRLNTRGILLSLFYGLKLEMIFIACYKDFLLLVEVYFVEFRVIIIILSFYTMIYVSRFSQSIRTLYLLL